MSSDIVPKGPELPATLITNIKENRVNNFDIKDSQVSFNINLSAANQNEMMLAVSQFSKEYYQLIVTAADIFDTDSGSAVSIPTDRALKQHSVPDEIFDRCSSLSDEGIEELKTFPAIICSEKLDRYYADVDAKHMAIFAYIRKIKKCRKEIKIYYTPLQMIPLRILCENPIDYGIDVDCALSDFNVTAWTVHKINLFEAFDDTGIRGVPTPM